MHRGGRVRRRGVSGRAEADVVGQRWRRTGAARCGTQASCRRQASGSAVGEVDAVDGDPAGGRGDEAEQQAEQRALAGAAGPDDGDPLAGPDGQGHVPQRGGPLVRARSTRSKPDLAPAPAGHAGRPRRPGGAGAARGRSTPRPARPAPPCWRGTGCPRPAAAGTPPGSSSSTSSAVGRVSPPPSSRMPTGTATSATESGGDQLQDQRGQEGDPQRLHGGDAGGRRPSGGTTSVCARARPNARSVGRPGDHVEEVPAEQRRAAATAVRWRPASASRAARRRPGSAAG